jgi:hypothetical protein
MSEDTENTETQPEVSLDDLFSDGVNQDTLEQASKEMLLPVGTYVTIPPFTITKHGKDKNGRKYARFFGTIQLGEKTGKIGLAVSPEYRHPHDAEGNELEGPDRSYKNYVMASKAYKAAYGCEPAKEIDVLKYLSEYPVKLRVIQTSNGENMVVSISAVRN